MNKSTDGFSNLTECKDLNLTLFNNFCVNT